MSLCTFLHNWYIILVILACAYIREGDKTEEMVVHGGSSVSFVVIVNGKCIEPVDSYWTAAVVVPLVS